MKKIFTLLLAVLFFTNLDAQIAFQGFEGSAGDTWAFINSPATYNTSGDVWDEVGSVGSITSGATSSSTFWGMQDLNNPNGGGNFDHTLTFTQDVSNHVMVTVSFFYNAVGYDSGDDLDYELFYDNVSQGRVNLIDGVNGGGVSTGGWLQEVVNVPDNVSSVSLVLIATQNGGSDYAGWDNVEIDGQAAAPVELTSFTATAASKKAIQLNWSTASEENNEGFVIEHSINGVDFSEVDFMQGFGTSWTANDYTYLHEAPAKGLNYYRLKQMDYDGAFDYSPVRAVELKGNRRFTVRPTLAHNHIEVNVESNGIVEIYDISGRRVISTQISADDTQSIDISSLNNGQYFVRFSSDRDNETLRFVKAN